MRDNLFLESKAGLLTQKKKYAISVNRTSKQQKLIQTFGKFTCDNQDETKTKPNAMSTHEIVVL